MRLPRPGGESPSCILRRGSGDHSVCGRPEWDDPALLEPVELNDPGLPHRFLTGRSKAEVVQVRDLLERWIIEGDVLGAV